MEKKLERVQKEAVMAKYSPSICLKGTNKTTNNLRQDSDPSVMQTDQIQVTSQKTFRCSQIARRGILLFFN